MSTLSYFLDRTDQSIASINALKFHPAGLFTNAIVKRPSITTLLKDPSADEGALYKISKPKHRIRHSSNLNESPDISNNIDMEIRPERADGKSIYVDRSYTEYTQYKGETRENGAENKTVVKLPELAKTVSTSTDAKNLAMLSKEIPNDIGGMCGQILELIRLYPNLIENRDSIIEKVVRYQNEYDLLVNQCANLESEIDDQKRQLTILNINYSDIGSPVKASSEIDRSDENDNDTEGELDIDDYIAQEEQEIRQLEEQLDVMQSNQA